jgi:hypothetical protein
MWRAWVFAILWATAAQAEPCKYVALCLADERRPVDERVALVAQARTEIKTMNEKDRAQLIGIYLWAVLDDAELLRKALADAIVEAGLLSPAAAAQIPARKEIGRKLHDLFTSKQKEKDRREMRAQDCQVRDEASAGTVRIDCESLLGCSSSCTAKYGAVTLLVGPKGWKLEKGEIRHKPSNGGDCGDCL